MHSNHHSDGISPHIGFAGGQHYKAPSNPIGNAGMHFLKNFQTTKIIQIKNSPIGGNHHHGAPTWDHYGHGHHHHHQPSPIWWTTPAITTRPIEQLEYDFVRR
jgi:hypothetical protein